MHSTRHLRHVPSLLLAACLLSACYRAETITGSVVDETTGKPLAGVAVAANWQATGATFDQRERGHIALFETTSDAQGNFHIDAWGPRWHWLGKVDKVKASLFLFKSGYQGQTFTKESAGNAGYLAWINIAPDPATVKLKPAAQSQRERIENFDMFNVALRPLLYEPASCPWNRTFGLLRELHAETLQLLPNSRESGGWPLMTLDQDLITHADQLAKEAGPSCASPKEIFRLQSAP